MFLLTPTMYHFGVVKDIIYFFDERYDFAKIEGAVVKDNGQRHNLANGNFFFAFFIYHNHRFIFRGADGNCRHLRRNNLKQGDRTALPAVNGTDIGNRNRALLNIVLG